MPTVTSLLALTIDPASADRAHAVVHETLAATRARPGCLGVDVLVDVEDPLRLVCYERWESLEADDAYRAWRATPEGASRLGEVLADGGRALTRYTTAEGV